MQKHILVIDDDKSIGMTLKKLLVKEGFRVTLAFNGTEALALVENGEFDLIMSDLKMPGMDGVETILKIRAVRSQRKQVAVPEIFITGYAREEIFRRALDLKAAAYIEKPFDLKPMLSAIAKCLVKESA